MGADRIDTSHPDPGLDSLLRPTLQDRPPAEPLYSVRANFLVAFFGGVFAAAFFGGLNAMRMRCLERDGWFLGLAALLWSGFLVWAGQAFASDMVPDWMTYAGTAARTVRSAGTLGGLLLFGAIYLRRRAYFKAQDLAGVEVPNPWPAGLLALGISIVLSLLCVAAGLGLARV